MCAGVDLFEESQRAQLFEQQLVSNYCDKRRRRNLASGERGWTRTIDPCLKRALLCQLSYAPTSFQSNTRQSPSEAPESPAPWATKRRSAKLRLVQFRPRQTSGKLPQVRYPRATHSRAILKLRLFVETVHSMAAESNPRKDTLKVEKTSLAILAACIIVLVGLLVFRPF